MTLDTPDKFAAALANLDAGKSPTGSEGPTLYHTRTHEVAAVRSEKRNGQTRPKRAMKRKAAA